MVFFPVGVYGGSADNLGQIKGSGLNSAVVGLDEKNIAACSAADIHCAFSVSRDPERLIRVFGPVGAAAGGGTVLFLCQ